MSLKDTIAADLQTIECDLDNPTFTWQGEDFACLPSSGAESATLEEGGFDIISDLSLTVRSNQFMGGITPLKQQKIIYRDKAYRILRVSLDVSGALLRLLCVDAGRGV